MTDIQTSIAISIVSDEHGFDDLDVSGIPYVYRICVPHSIKRGGNINIYCDNDVKFGAIWKGSVERSLTYFAENHESYRQFVDEMNGMASEVPATLH